ncbi:MAG: L-threonylcarbamoyladenylate synthase, partial [Aquificota bacterium]|nr:L-threonylcarbamoyladenylate synthase [Aquificota bacterium]
SRAVSEKDPRAPRTASEVLSAGEFVVAPTDTIYWILADATNFTAVRRLYELRRPSRRPFIVLLPDLSWTGKMGLEVDPLSGRLLLKPFITVVLRKRGGLFHWLGRESLAVRIPRRGFVRRVLELLGRPVVAPSANREGKPPARSVEEAVRYFGDEVSLYVDGGVISGRPSALIGMEDSPKVLRRGPYTEESLKGLLRPPPPCQG